MKMISVYNININPKDIGILTIPKPPMNFLSSNLQEKSKLTLTDLASYNIRK
jgi:predicted secreted protein